MKRIRLVILTGLLIAALALAVVPALAAGPNYGEILNWSFEGDKNGDNIPDKWNVKGDVMRLCDHQYASFDNCMMVFKPSNKAAAVWQILDAEAYSWTVNSEEALCVVGVGYVGAYNLPSERALLGAMINYTDGSQITAYILMHGGTYPINGEVFELTLPNCNPDLPDKAEAKWGVLTLPGDGYLGLDAVFLSSAYID